MKRHRLSFVLIVLLISITILGLFSVESLGAETLDFTFEENVLFDETNPIFDTEFNLRNVSVYTGHYPATYSFTNDIVGNTPIGFNVLEVGGSVRVIASENNHNNVLEMDDDGTDLEIYAEVEILEIVSGTIEFWMLLEQTNKGVFLYVEDGSPTDAISFAWAGGITQFYNTSWNTVNNYVANSWYHIRIDFECGAGAYLGLGADKFNVGINGESFGPYEMKGNPSEMDAIRFRSQSITPGIYNIDALGLNWDGYNATYSFENDIIGELPDGWTQTTATGVVAASWQRHEKVFKCTSAGGGSLYRFYQSFTAQADGDIDLYINTSNATDYHGFYLGKTASVGAADIAVYVYTGADVLWARKGNGAGGSVGVSMGALADNAWAHVRVHFDTATDTFSVWRDGINYVDGENFYNDNVFAADELNTITLYGPNVAGAIGYWDAFGYSWDDYYEIGDNLIHYSIGDNLVPTLNISNTLEVDKWEFFSNEDGTSAIDEQGDVPFWDEIGSYSRIGAGFQDFEDGIGVVLEVYGTTHEGIYYDINETNGEVREVSFRIGHNWNIPELAGITQYYDIKSYDGTLIVRLKIGDYNASHSKLYQYDGASYNELQLTENNFHYYTLDLTIVENIVLLDVNSTINYYFPLITSNKEGLGEIRIECFLDAEHLPLIVHIDYIGVYIDGVSVSTDFASYYSPVNLDFNNKEYNLFYINASGYFALSIVSFEVNPQVFDYFSYQNVSEISFMNVYNKTERNVINAYLSIITNNSDFSINSLRVTGVKLTDGIDDFIPSITGGNINNTESYFYVDSNNRLQYSLVANDSNNEYIQAIFDITNIPSENRSVRFSSNINGDAYGFFSVNYYDSTASVFEVPYYTTTTIVILPQTKIVDSFLILITDNDLSDDTICTGYISNIGLIYNPDIQVVIITLTLLAIIVPLIIMIVPPITLHKKFGITGVFVMFLLMSIICVVTGLIPIWLFFIIALSSIGLLAMKKEIGDKI